MSTNPSTPALGLVPPNGLDQILATFGDIFDYIGPDHTPNPRWQNEFLQRIALLFPIPLSWDMSRRVNQITCHKRLCGCLYRNIYRHSGCQPARQNHQLRRMLLVSRQRTGAKLSAHSWGIALDLNTATNARGIAGNIDPAIVEIFGTAGFKWGGDWHGKSRDAMHFQCCTGY
jgi:hypothetical protein